MLAVFNGAAFIPSGGLAAPAAFATVEVRREDTGALASIFSDEAGTIGITNPSAFADANGRFSFYALGLERGYSVKVTSGAFTDTRHNVAVGTSAQFDCTTFASTLLAAASAAAARTVLAALASDISTLSAESAPDVADLLALRDVSAGTTDKITLADLLKVINTLTEDTSPDELADFVLMYDTSAAAPKKVKPSNIETSSIGTATATTSGTAVDYTVPSGVRRVVVPMFGVSLSGSDNVLVQIGPTAGVETSGYTSSSLVAVASAVSSSAFTSTAGFIIAMANAVVVVTGAYVIELVDDSTNSWVAFFVGVATNSNNITLGAGQKSLAGPLTKVRITVSGANTFDAGKVNCKSEK